MYKRILLKLSGESLMGSKQYGIDEVRLAEYAQQIKEVAELGVQIGIVIGGGNICRGAVQAKVGFDRVSGDYMGMLSTVINALAVSSTLEQKGVKTTVFSALGKVSDRVKEYNPDDANVDLSEGKVCFFAGGIGKPYFTTDTGAATRAVETKCEAILMGKHGVDGVYDKDPNKYEDAKRFDELSFDDILRLNLQVIDRQAAELCAEYKIGAFVFNMSDKDNIIKAVKNEAVGTIIKF